MGKILKKIWNVVTNVLVILIVLLALAFVGGKILGMQTYIVLSGSMEPTYSTGSLLYVKDVEPSELSEGDVITYRLTGDTLVTHRIVEMVPSEENPSDMLYRTKGDANETEDANLVSADQLVGTPVFNIPYLGYLADYVMNPPGRYIAIAVAAVLILLMFLPDLFEEDEGKKKKKDKKPKNESSTWKS